MSKKIRIRAGSVVVEAELDDTETARAIWEKLPIEATARTWGDEIYFSIPVRAELDETATDVVGLGDLGYWPTGNAFCIFFGPTPMSRGDEIRPASAVNIVGRIVGDLTLFKNVEEGVEVLLEIA